MINVIEKQLSKLRHLLHLHEQFTALISDIVTFITKYSSVVNEIGKSSNSIQNKIKQFEEVFNRNLLKFFFYILIFFIFLRLQLKFKNVKQLSY